MAKKVQAQKLQAEISTFEELEEFLQQPCLLVLDIYADWCGPCTAMVACLRKVKLEFGGDDLQLAIVNVENIDVLKRFRNNSEPMWLFILNGKVINSYFGSNAPVLTELIKNELESTKDISNLNRNVFELNELTPLEMERYNAEKLNANLLKRAEIEAAELKTHQYIEFVTDEIMSRASDMGVTIFMPHVINRDLYKRVLEVADKLHLSAKDRVMVKIPLDHLKIINFECINLPLVLYEQIKAKEVFMVCWKISDDELRPVEVLLKELKELLIEKTPDESETVPSKEIITEQIDIDKIEETEIGLNLKSLSVIIDPKWRETMIRLNSVDLQFIEDDCEFAKYVVDFAIGYVIKNKQKSQHLEQDLASDIVDEFGLEKSDQKYEQAREIIYGVLDSIFTENLSSESYTIISEPVSEMNDIISADIEEKTSLASLFDATNPNKIRIPAVWTPSNKRANASLIYLYFRVLTEHFLPPDPKPDPPHLAMAFSASKQSDILEIISEYQDDVLSFGYFDCDNYKKAKLIATSHTAYNKLQPNVNDKILLKLSNDSDAILAFAGNVPSFVSQNISDGKFECEAFFPEGYTNDLEDEKSDDGNDKVIEQSDVLNGTS